MRFATWLISVFLLTSTPLAAGEYAVAVSFEFPERAPAQVSISYSEVVKLTGVKHPYMVEFWVTGALAKANLKYTADLVDGRRTITSIDDVSNDATGTWVYFVDGVRSKYHINTQTAPQPRTIRFVFEKTRIPVANAETVTVAGTDISFSPPAGFTPLTQEELDIKFPSKNGPKFAYGNERRTTTIAYDVKLVAVTTDALRKDLEAIGQSIARAIPGVVWVERKMVSLGGLDWACFEMTSSALDADIHNIILMGAWQGKMVVFNFNATKSDFTKLEPELRASMKSVAVKKT